MTRYTVAATACGWIVALRRASGGLIATTEHATRESAQRECDRLNRQWHAAEATRLQNAERMQQQAERARRLARDFPEFLTAI